MHPQACALQDAPNCTNGQGGESGRELRRPGTAIALGGAWRCMGCPNQLRGAMIIAHFANGQRPVQGQTGAVR